MLAAGWVRSGGQDNDASQAGAKVALTFRAPDVTIAPEDQAVARRAVLFASLPADLSAELFARSGARRFSRGETIFLQDESAEHVFVVLEGWVKLFRVTPTGAEAVVGVFTKGRSFGEAVAFRGECYPVSAEAVTDCRLLQARAATILDMMQRRPELAMAMLGATYAHLQALVSQIEQLKAQNGPQRVAEFLASLCPVESGSCAVTLPYDKTLIAGRLGMKPESLSRAFARLRAHGVRIEHNLAVIADVAQLRELIDEERAPRSGRAQ